MKIPLTIKLEVGDWSKDGHNQSDVFLIQSNLTQQEIELAYKEGCKLVGFDFSKICCQEYEDSSIKAEHIKKLKAAGINFGSDDPDSDDNPLEFEEIPNDDGSQSLRPKSFCNIYLEIAKLGNKDFNYKYIKSSKDDSIKVGGYGLYH
jgi:hypothetical protein